MAPDPNEWQFVDPTNGFIFPWLTLDFLEYLITLDTSTWRVFETGTGCGTLWLAAECKEVITLDTQNSWFNRTRRFAKEKKLSNVDFNLFLPSDKSQDVNDYLSVLSKQVQKFDAVIVDGIFRDEVAIEAVDHIKEDGLLIADNYQQEDVWDAIDCSKFLNERYPIKVYRQSPIPDPGGHPWVWKGNRGHFSKLAQGHPHWQTACWRI